MLVKDIYDFEYILTSSEVESLLLEINLIKKYTPKYNILYKDDKSYPYIELTNDKYPRLLIVRQINPKRGKNRCLFGPYPNVYAAKKTVEILNRIYIEKSYIFEFYSTNDLIRIMQYTEYNLDKINFLLESYTKEDLLKKIEEHLLLTKKQMQNINSSITQVKKVPKQKHILYSKFVFCIKKPSSSCLIKFA